MLKLLIKIAAVISFLLCPVFAQEHSFVSIVPSLTEIMYAIDAQNMLKAVSSQCNFPEDAKQKPIIGDFFFVNEDMLLNIHPDYLLTGSLPDSAFNKYEKLGIKTLSFKYSNINSIYDNIITLGKLTDKEKNAEILVQNIKSKIIKARELNKNPHKKILYVISMKPFRTIGAKSFISSVITESGHNSVTQELNTDYPVVSLEYVINKNPDIVIIDYHCVDNKDVQLFFPKAKIIKMTKEQADIIDRPSPRVYKSVEFFASLGNN